MKCPQLQTVWSWLNPPLSVSVALSICLLFTASNSVASAQPAASDTRAVDELEVPARRADRWRQKRLEKAQSLKPHKKQFWESYLYGFDQKGHQSLEDSNFWGFYPRLDWIARGSGPALGVRYWKPDAGGKIDIMGAAFYSVRSYQHYELNLGLIPNRGKKIPSRSFTHEEVNKLAEIDYRRFARFKLYGTARYRYKPEEKYFGSGPDSQLEDETTYLLEDALLGLTTGYQFTDRVSWTLTGGFIQHSLGQGRKRGIAPTDEKHDEETAPAISVPPDYFRVGTYLLWDMRDDPGLPHRGFSLTFGWEKWSETTFADLFNFHRWGGELRTFLPLGSRQRVLAFRAIGVNSDPTPGNQVPFFLKPSLGGGETLRGYDSYRFRGDKIMLFQAEYRWEASRRWELALFGDSGTVADKGQRLSLNKLKSNWGLGLRFKTSSSTLFRIDQAFSNEGSRTQVRFSAVF